MKFASGKIHIHELSNPSLRRPVLIHGLPGLGYVGKIAADYLIEELRPEPLAELYSAYLFLSDGSAGVSINLDGTFDLPKLEFYAYGEGKTHFIVVTGDVQPLTLGQYEVINAVLDFAQSYGCPYVVALGGFQTRLESEIGKVYGVASNRKLVEKLVNLGVQITRSGAITGACGLVLGLAKHRGMDGVGLLGATRGEHPDMMASRSLLKVLSKLLDIPIDTKRLEEEIREMREKMESLRRFQREVHERIRRSSERRALYV